MWNPSSGRRRLAHKLTAVLGATAIALPVAGVAKAATAQTAVTKVVTKKLAGSEAVAGEWGSVTINVTLRTTTRSGKTTKKYTDLGGSYTYHTGRSQLIMSQALPLLRQEFLKAQSANIQMISGATMTSQAFEESLQSALRKASK
jgi:uncharacterized protein with FMN-binding domain